MSRLTPLIPTFRYAAVRLINVPEDKILANFSKSLWFNNEQDTAMEVDPYVTLNMYLTSSSTRRRIETRYRLVCGGALGTGGGFVSPSDRVSEDDSLHP